MKSRDQVYLIVLIMLSAVLFVHSAAAGPYAPAAGQPGSTAIHKDDAAFVGWATGIDVVRGPQDIRDTESADASYGTANKVLGKADGTSVDVVSLGDSGYATVTFDFPIIDGPGYDFAVFENSFSDTYLELAFVEVSSDGENYFRFPSISLTQVESQVGGFDHLDPTNLYNLAGKYRRGYGTPFDLDELAPYPELDFGRITNVRLVDVTGSIDPLFARYDSQEHIVNDPWPTEFSSGGFDLDAVGVINHAVPLPGAFWLLVSGLAALFAVKRTHPRLR